MTHNSAIPAVALFALALAATPAAAQFSGASGNLQTPSVAKPRGRDPVVQAPPALPGARAEPTAVIPASKAAAELPPTEALFDSINRGDLASAKDAVNRGADLSGRNVLGLTPLELSVDLGRNQISFLLLSLRGGAGFSTTSGPGPEPKPPGRAERLAADRAEKAERTARERTARAQPAQPVAPQTARLFAGNGGTPVPQAGFLGFDSNR